MALGEEIGFSMVMGLLAIFSIGGLIWLAGLVLTDKDLKKPQRNVALTLTLAGTLPLAYLSYMMYF
jgi:hypothetical protein